MTRQAFISLPVKDLAASTEFFAKLGFSFDPQFTDDNATRMILTDDASVMIMVEPFFRQFVEPQAVADTSVSREVLVGVSAESREEVNELAGKAIAAGAQDRGGPRDDGFMYMWGFRDLDGHQWSFIYMDFSAIPQQ